MLLKTLKYDFKAIRRIWTMLSFAILLIAVICGAALRYIIDKELNSSDSFLSPLSVIVLILSIFALIAYMIAPSIVLYVRYYKNFYTDEGYLTFTLPVKRETLLLSKTLNALIWSSLTAFVAAFGVMIALLIAPANRYGEGNLLAEAFSSINESIKLSGGDYGYFFLKLFLGIIIALLGSVLTTLLVYGCITIASSIAKRMKLLACVLLIYGLNTAVTVIGYLLITLGVWFTEGLETLEELGGYSSSPSSTVIIMLTVIFALSAIIPLVYKFVLNRIEKRINLA